MKDFNQNGTPLRLIWVGNRQRELRQYQGYWYIILTPREMEEWPGIHWNGYVLYHKYKWWKTHGEWFPGTEMRYCYVDGDRDNIRITNIDLRPVGAY
jgi:hypothetical protein